MFSRSDFESATLETSGTNCFHGQGLLHSLCYMKNENIAYDLNKTIVPSLWDAVGAVRAKKDTLYYMKKGKMFII